MRYPQIKLITDGPDPFVFSEAKIALKVDHDYDDELLYTCLRTASDDIAGEMGRALLTQTWEAYYQAWPCHRFLIPLPPLQTVNSIKYKLSGGGSYLTLDAANYVVDTENEPGRVFLADDYVWPSESLFVVNPIVINFTCGYTDIDLLPDSITRAILWQAQHIYDHRNPVIVGAGIVTKPLERGLDSTIQKWKVRFADEFSISR